jgi:hypothetical protein
MEQKPLESHGRSEPQILVAFATDLLRYPEASTPFFRLANTGCALVARFNQFERI